MSNPTISAGYPKALLDFAVSRGADRDALLARSAIAAGDLGEPDNHIPVERYLALFRAGIALTNDSALPLEFGKAVRMQEISIVGLIAEACATTPEVPVQLNRYARLVVGEDGGGASPLMSGRRDEHGLWIEMPNPLFIASLHMMEAEMARLTWNAKLMFAGTDFMKTRPFPRAVRFTHADPGYASDYERIFTCPVEFSSDRNGLLTDVEFLELKQPPTNRYVFGVLSERAEALLKELEASKTERAKVEALLMPILHTGDISMDAVAARMGLSRQTLFRRLKTEGATFEKVLDDLRHRLALHYLDGKRVSVGEAAYLTGFSDRTAFSRAFKRWTGVSPGKGR